LATPSGSLPFQVAIFDANFTEVNEVVTDLFGQVQLLAQLRWNLITLIPIKHSVGWLTKNFPHGFFEILEVVLAAEILVSTQILGRVLVCLLAILILIKQIIIIIFVISLVPQLTGIVKRDGLVLDTNFLLFNYTEVSFIFVLLDVI